MSLKFATDANQPPHIHATVCWLEMKKLEKAQAPEEGGEEPDEARQHQTHRRQVKRFRHPHPQTRQMEEYSEVVEQSLQQIYVVAAT